MNKQQYQEYLRSAHWKNVRARAIFAANYRCEQCEREHGNVTLEVHHLTYERVGHEHPDDLAVLCSSCHEELHMHEFVPMTASREDRERGKAELKKIADDFFQHQRKKFGV